jgi:hypothetical protein
MLGVTFIMNEVERHEVDECDLCHLARRRGAPNLFERSEYEHTGIDESRDFPHKRCGTAHTLSLTQSNRTRYSRRRSFLHFRRFMIHSKHALETHPVINVAFAA